MQDTSNYSRAFYETFAAAIPAGHTALEADATARLAPPEAFPRLLEVACGTGRVIAALAARGFDVTGIDANVEALRAARLSTPRGRFVGLDFRHIGKMRWTFDVVVSYWNSIGFSTRADDEDVLRAMAAILRPGGRLLLDLYHPDWLAAHQMRGVRDPRGALVDRWLEDGRSCHRFEYADGSVDDIRFNVYRPGEMTDLLARTGYVVDAPLVWWAHDDVPSAAYARYQLAARTGASRPPSTAIGVKAR